jgi:hypothetical protein
LVTVEVSPAHAVGTWTGAPGPGAVLTNAPFAGILPFAGEASAS